MPAVSEATAFAAFFREYGALAGLVLSLGLNWLLLGRWADCFNARVAEGAATAAALEKSSSTHAAVSAALQSRIGYFERVGEKIDAAAATISGRQETIIAKLDALADKGGGRR